MIKKFEQFHFGSINEGVIEMGEDPTVISPDSSYWQKAVDLFRSETGKDLKSFKWVFQGSNNEGAIIPENFIIALLASSPILSKYKGMISYVKDFLSQGNLSYEAGTGADYVHAGANSLQNSAALYKIWINYFYTPIKNAAQTKNFDSITPSGMEPFEERMHIFSMDFDSDWSQFFSALKLGLQPVESVGSTSPQAPIQAPTTQKAPTQKPASSPKAKAGYSLPTSFD